MMPQTARKITEVAGTTFENLYYDLNSNQFFTKRIGNTNCFWPVMWKRVTRNYANQDGKTQNRLYTYINLYDTTSKKRVRISEKCWNEEKKRYYEDDELTENDSTED
jgi:hypothetical protein